MQRLPSEHRQELVRHAGDEADHARQHDDHPPRAAPLHHQGVHLVDLAVGVAELAAQVADLDLEGGDALSVIPHRRMILATFSMVRPPKYAVAMVRASVATKPVRASV